MIGLTGLIFSLSLVSGRISVTSPADSVPGSLRAALAAAGPGDTLRFSIPDQDTLSLKDSVSIRQDVFIDGSSNAATGKRVVFVLDSLKGAIAIPALRISKGRVGLKGMEIRGGVQADRGVKLRMEGVEVRGARAKSWGIASSADTSMLIDCVIKDNKGGGLLQDTGRLIMDGCRISGNENGNHAAGIEVQFRGIAAIRNSVFSGNRGSEDAGAISNDGRMEVGGCEFTANSGESGGGIYNSGWMRLQDSKFKGNEAHGVKGTWGGHGRGGAIFNGDTLFLVNVEIDSNTCRGPSDGVDSYGGTASGGGIFNSGEMRLTGCRIRGNSSRGESGGSRGYGGTGFGGGIHNEGHIRLDLCAIDANQALGYGAGYGGKAAGGGLWNSGEMLVERSSITGNIAEGSEGDSYGGEARAGGIHNAGRLNVVNATVFGNHAIGHNGRPFKGSAMAGGLYNLSYAGIAFSTFAGNMQSVKGGESSWGPANNDIYNRDSVAIANSIVYGRYSDSLDDKGKAQSVFLERGLPANAVGSLDGSGFELFGQGKAEPSDYGGPTLTIALDSGSIARGAGIPLGTCEAVVKMRDYDRTVILPVYYDGSAWRTLERDSAVAKAGVTPIATDQRGYQRPDPPSRGAYDFGVAVSGVRGIARMERPFRYLGMQGNRLGVFLPVKDDYRIDLFDMQGRVVWSRRCLLDAGMQCLALTGRPAGAEYVLRISGGKHPYSSSFRIR